MFNYITNFEDSLYTLQKVTKIMKNLRNIDIATECGNDPFYEDDYGIFYPLTVHGNVIAYLMAPIGKNKIFSYRRLDAARIEELVRANTLKLLPKTVKALSTVSAGNRMCSTNHGQYGANPSLRLKNSEIIKALILGYITAPSDENLIDLIVNSNYNLQSMFGSRPSKIDPKIKIKTVIDTMNNPTEGNNNGEGWATHYSNQLAKRICTEFVRSNKVFDETHVLKWRKPSKNSAWPWTLDHHWFMVQESPITLANYTYKALLGGGSRGNHDKRDKIDNQYPVFSKNNALEHARRMLETFFDEVVGNRSKARWGDVVYTTQNMRWLSDNPCFLIPKLCLVLNVVPSFDASGKFQKFVPMPGYFTQNTEKLYLELTAMNIDQTSDLEPFITMILALCYDLGIVKLDVLEKTLGVVNGGAALKNNPNYFKANVGNNLVCCLPKSYSYDMTVKALAKFNAAMAEQAKKEEPVFDV